MKLDKFELMFIDIVKSTARLSTCTKHNVGAILVKDRRVLLQGYNGTVSGFINCKTKFGNVQTWDEDITRQHKQWSESFELHAEMNLLTYAAKYGIALDNSEVYCTHTPCNNCLKHLISAGVKRVSYLYDYVDKSMLQDRVELLKMIEIRKLEI
jgi:dCMP deaminase